MLKQIVRISKKHFNKVFSSFLSLYIILGPVLSISSSGVFAAAGNHPQVTVTSPTDGSYVNGIVDIRGTVDDPNDDLNFYHVGVFHSYDDTWNFSKDLLVPDVTIHSEVTDGSLYKWDTSSFADGQYLIRVAAVDLAGNKDPMTGSGNVEGDSVKIIPVTVDHTMPVVDVTSHNNGDYVHGSVTVAGTVNDTNLWRYWFVVTDSLGNVKAGPGTVYNNGPVVNPSFVWDTTKVPNGDYQIVLSARDKADNKQDPGVSTETVNVKVLNLQTPVILYPNEGDAFKTTPILNDWTDSAFAPGLLKYVIEYQYDDGHSFSGGPYRESTISQRNHVPNISEEGGVKFRVKAVADPGNESAWSEWRHYNYDITAGTSLFVTPADGGKFNSPIPVSGNSLDNVGIDFVTLYFRNAGSEDWTEITKIYNPAKNSPFNWNYDWTPSIDGTYDLKVSSTDKAGNVENTDYVLGIEYDATAPDVPGLVSPSNGAYIKPASAWLDWTDVTDPNGHGPVTYNYRSSWSGGGHYGPVSTGTNSIINATASAYRTYQWQVQACDSFGNCSDWSGPWTVTIDGAAPTTPHWTNTPRFTQNGDYAYTVDKVRMDMQFTESTDNFSVHHYDYQFVRADLDGNKLQSGQVNMNSYLGGVSCTGGICTWKPDLQDNSQWIFRMRAVDNAGNTSAWSNWNSATDSEFYNFSFGYQDFKTNTGIFGRSDYNGGSGNGSYVVRENVNPVSEITSPTGVFETNNPDITIHYTTGDDGTQVKNVKLYDGDDNLVATSIVGEFNITLPEEDGIYCYYTVAEDIADNASRDLGVGNLEAIPEDRCELTIILDTTKPEVSSLISGDFNEGDTIPDEDVIGMDSSTGVTKLCYETYFDSGYIGSDCVSASTTELMYVWNVKDILGDVLGAYLDKFDTSVINEGTYDIEYYVEDAVGNQSTTKTVRYTVTNVVPNVVLGSNQTILAGSNASFTGSFTDPSYIPDGAELMNVLNNFNGNTADDSTWFGYVNYGEGLGYQPLGTIDEPGSVPIPSNVYENPGVYSVSLKVCEASNEMELTGLSFVSPYPDPTGEAECGTSQNVIVTVNAIPQQPTPNNQGQNNTPQVQGATDTNAEENTDENTNNDTETSGEVLGTLTCTTKQNASGYVYDDKNGNGKKDDNEKGIEGVEVEVKYTDSEGKVVLVDTVTTDKDGKWTLELCPAEYKVNLKDNSLPVNYKLTNNNVLGIQVKAGEDLNNANIALEKESANWDWRWILIILALLLIISGGIYLYYRNRKNSVMNS